MEKKKITFRQIVSIICLILLMVTMFMCGVYLHVTGQSINSKGITKGVSAVVTTVEL